MMADYEPDSGFNMPSGCFSVPDDHDYEEVEDDEVQGA